MAVINPLSDLEAVNRMLASIGQAPVNTLEVSGIADVNKAKTQLRDAARDVQAVGWSWNTDDEYPLNPDADGFILVPNGALDIDPSKASISAVIRRHPEKGLALYDVDNQTFKWDDTVYCRVIWAFEFNDLPQAARSYIATAAARRFQAQTVSSTVLDAFNEADEERAWLLLKRRERATRDTNSFKANARLRNFVYRHRQRPR